jgi:hypothetical protein
MLGYGLVRVEDYVWHVTDVGSSLLSLTQVERRMKEDRRRMKEDRRRMKEDRRRMKEDRKKNERRQKEE